MASSMLRFVVVVVVVNLALVAALSEDGDLDVKVVKPKQSFGKMISSFSTSTHCHHTPAGLGRMIRGIDAAYLDLLPLSTDLTADMGYRSPIFDYTCNEGKKVFLDNVEYDLPDQVVGAESIPGGLKSAKVEIFRKLDQVINSMKLSVGIGDALGMFMLSPSLNFAHATLTNTSRYIEEVRAHVSAFRADHIPSWAMELTKYAKNYLDRRLTKSFSQDPKSYETFIKTFGTHFFQDAFFGGMLKLVIETESTYFETSTTVGVGLQAEGTFGNIVKLKGGAGVSHTNVDGNFKKLSKETMRYYGGRANLLDKAAGLKEWMPTVIGNPWLFRGNLKPIHELIADKDKSDNMKLAVQVHLDKAYLLHLRKAIESTVAAHGATSDTNKWMGIVKQETAKTIPDHNRLRTIGRDIEYHLVLPDWFKNNVELCFEWAPTTGFLNDANQCAQHQAGLPRKICSKIGKFTREYLDETDARIGGCYYSWRLQIVGKPTEPIPSYFKETQICHRWHSQDNFVGAGQCNRGRRDGTNCAKVGHSTAHYLDDTDWRPGGCEYSWIISVPGNAPMWLKNLQVCMKWRATGDRQQCGNNGVPPTICAKSNQWTRAYNDDSSARPGGCMMSWGMKSSQSP